MSKDKQYRYSEMFLAQQGEGRYTGTPTAWLRLWGCTLKCDGFGQENPDDETTWVKPREAVDPNLISTIEEAPIFNKGCDSYWSWDPRFRKLANLETVPVIVDKLEGLLKTRYNTSGQFLHEKSKQMTHLAFTGGEPMMSQHAIIAIVDELINRKNYPMQITVETNGTVEITTEMQEFLHAYQLGGCYGGRIPSSHQEWFWSVSPKLRASGEKRINTIKPSVVEAYSLASDAGQLKFVVDGDDRTWYEVDQAVKAYRDVGICWPVSIMAEGGTKESQNEDRVAKICDETVDRGFHFSARTHVYIYGNVMGK